MRLQQLLTEAKARIDHVEDLVFMQGTAGIRNAMMALEHVVDHPDSVTIKIDGSPALIFGRDQFGFTLTDKAGFARPDGLPRTAQALVDMLYLRRPTEVGRMQFAQSVASCWYYLEQLLPNKFQGYLQGDLLWTGQPSSHDNYWEFTPNKITYRVPVHSSMGQQIANSSMGLVIHSYFAQQQQSEPQAVDYKQLQLNTVPGLVVLDCQLPTNIQLTWPTHLAHAVESAVGMHRHEVDLLLSKPHLAALQISDFATVCKRFLAYRASLGHDSLSDLAGEFLNWISSNQELKLSSRKRSNIMVYATKNAHAFDTMWHVVANIIKIKKHIYQQLEHYANQRMQAYLRNKPQHEGFVAETPYGRIKLVNRAEFMLAET